MAKSRAPSRRSINIWPGFVDALSTLVLVFVFALMIFAIGHQVLRQNQADEIERLLRRTQILDVIDPEFEPD